MFEVFAFISVVLGIGALVSILESISSRLLLIIDILDNIRDEVRWDPDLPPPREDDDWRDNEGQQEPE